MPRGPSRSARTTLKPATAEAVSGTAPLPRKVAQILPAASDLFLENGFEGVTMDMVCVRAGVSKATLYVYFPSKEELFAAAIREETRRINQEISAPFENLWDSADDIEILLRKIARALIEMFLSERNVALQRAIYGALPRYRDAGQIVFGAGPSDLADRIARFLTAAGEAGRLDISDPMTAAKQFMSLARGDFDLSGILLLPRPSERSIEHAIDASIELFMARYRRG
jgi:TetR/AcrR family transcriptional regulator, mexJK operon transcriptional repressor